MHTNSPDPRDFDSIHAWLRATLQATGEAERHVALAIGMSKNAIAELLAHPQRIPGKPTLDRLAAHFGVDAVELRAMRPKRQDLAQRGRTGPLAGLSLERKREFAAIAREARRAKLSDPAERERMGRGIAAANRRRGPAFFAEIGEAGREAMSARGYHHTAEGRAAMSERVRRTGQSAAGARAAHAKYGDQHPGVLALRALVQSMEYRDWMRLHGQVTQVLLKVRQSGDQNLIERVEEQATAQRAYLKNPKRRGRPATLLRDKEIAIAAAIMHDEYEITARDWRTRGYDFVEDSRYGLGDASEGRLGLDPPGAGACGDRRSNRLIFLQ
jgi:hypothetical protein